LQQIHSAYSFLRHVSQPGLIAEIDAIVHSIASLPVASSSQSDPDSTACSSPASPFPASCREATPIVSEPVQIAPDFTVYDLNADLVDASAQTMGTVRHDAHAQTFVSAATHIMAEVGQVEGFRLARGRPRCRRSERRRRSRCPGHRRCSPLVPSHVQGFDVGSEVGGGPSAPASVASGSAAGLTDEDGFDGGKVLSVADAPFGGELAGCPSAESGGTLTSSLPRTRFCVHKFEILSLDGFPPERCACGWLSQFCGRRCGNCGLWQCVQCAEL
jgi:hypothetical protein